MRTTGYHVARTRSTGPLLIKAQLTWQKNRLPRFAILIDADDTSPRIAAGLFEEVAKFGEASVRRMYGDFSGQRLKSSADILPKYAIDPYQQFAYTTGRTRPTSHS